MGGRRKSIHIVRNMNSLALRKIRGFITEGTGGLMTHRNVKLKTLVKVTWTDSAFELGWRYGGKPVSLPLITSIGYVTHCDKTMIEIASSVGDKGVLNPLGLPFGMILKIKELHG